MLAIYNSLTHQKETFKPINPGQVKMYVCGVTVYDQCHMGHARTFVAFDVVVRYLRYLGYQVSFVRNITDIDDKIINRANQINENFSELTERYIGIMHQDFDVLGMLRPDIEPRATAHIEQIIQLIASLVAQGKAYPGENGDVYFQVGKFPAYGRLSRQNLEMLRVGSRVDVERSKRDPLDFVLWKQAKSGEPSWPSPWGNGRPGWHIECSAMAKHCLGEPFDIHGGGSDLLFPHHENEIAQSEAASGKQFARTWMHTGMVQVDKEKMAKSLGNFFTIREVLQDFPPEVARYFMLTCHYRSSLNFSRDNLHSAASAMERLYIALRDVNLAKGSFSDGEFKNRFEQAMSDDFNTPIALSVLFDMAKSLNKAKLECKGQVASELATQLKAFGEVLGILQQQPDDFLQSSVAFNLSGDEIDQLIVQRDQARRAGNWSEADRIRQCLADEKVLLEDQAGTTTWRRA